MSLRNLKAYRIKYNLTQEDMASKLGISIVAYRNKENGHNQFTLAEAKIISDLFNASITEIFFENNVYTKETKQHDTI